MAIEFLSVYKLHNFLLLASYNKFALIIVSKSSKYNAKGASAGTRIEVMALISIVSL